MANRNFLLLAILFLFSCASVRHSQATSEDEPLSPHQVCLHKEQDEKKAVYDALPDLLKQLSGDSQLIAEFPSHPSRKALEQAIAKVPEIPDAREWGTPKEGHAHTVSAYVVRRSELSEPATHKNVSLFRFSLGQPGRPYTMPIDSFHPNGSELLSDVDKAFIFTPAVGLPEDRKPYKIRVKATMRIQPISDRVILVSIDDRGRGKNSLNFESKNYFLVRTYEHRDFATTDTWQEWPVYDEGSYESKCDSIK